MKLNLGAGFDEADGYLRIDLAGQPDVRCDARQLPFRQESFLEVKAHHILEHIPREQLIPLMNDCWRVLEPGGTMDIELPIFPSEAAMADPTHVSFFVAGTFDYFTRDRGHDEHRILYGIKPWMMLRRERLGFNDILGVTLQKCA